MCPFGVGTIAGLAAALLLPLQAQLLSPTRTGLERCIQQSLALGGDASSYELAEAASLVRAFGRSAEVAHRKPHLDIASAAKPGLPEVREKRHGVV